MDLYSASSWTHL